MEDACVKIPLVLILKICNNVSNVIRLIKTLKAMDLEDVNAKILTFLIVKSTLLENVSLILILPLEAKIPFKIDRMRKSEIYDSLFDQIIYYL